MIKLVGINKIYRTNEIETVALEDVNLTVNKGEFLSIMGPSGCGKSTLLNIMGLLDTPTGGSIEVAGTRIESMKDKELAAFRNKKLGFVFQDFMLLDGLTVFENVCIPKVIREEPYRKMEEKAKELLAMFGIEQIKDKYPAEISGGQKQRTAVARALMNEPLLILADEPTGNLDSRSSEAVIKAFLEAKRKLGATTFMVTHDSFSASYCDRVIVMKDGKVFQELVNSGEPRVFMEELLEVLGRMNGGDQA